MQSIFGRTLGAKAPRFNPARPVYIQTLTKKQGGIMVKKTFDVTTHIFVPEHVLLTEKEKNTVYEKFSITFKELPKIFANDPAIKSLKLKSGDVVKIVKKSPTAGIAEYFRGVVSE